MLEAVTSVSSTLITGGRGKPRTGTKEWDHVGFVSRDLESLIPDGVDYYGRLEIGVHTSQVHAFCCTNYNCVVGVTNDRAAFDGLGSKKLIVSNISEQGTLGHPCPDIPFLDFAIWCRELYPTVR